MSFITDTIERCMKGLLPARLGVLYQHDPRPLPDVVIPNPPPFPAAAARISIVTPSFKQGHFIRRTINSILAQEYPNLEYVVQDGGSPDDTVAVLKSYGHRITSWVSETDQGQSDALNKGFAKTTGEIMAYLNSDDLLMPGSLAVVADHFARHPEVDAVYGHRFIIDEDDREVGRWVMPPHDDRILAYADYIPQETLFWRRSAWDKAGGRIDDSFRFAMDWDLILRLQDTGATIERLPFFLGAFRVHSAGKTTSIINEVGAKEMDRLRLRALGYAPDHHEINRVLRPYLAMATVLHHLDAYQDRR
jgi:glycosyltransferase involved in cell wall biosynthesis